MLTFIFISGLLISLVLYNLGSYVAFVSFFFVVGKVALVLLMLIVAFFVIRWLVRKNKLRLPFLRS